MQGWGMLLSCLFVLLFIFLGMPLEYVWRVVLILGAIPSAAVIYMRSKMEESAIFAKAHSGAAAGEDYTLAKHVSIAFGILKKHWHPMVGTTMTWLLLDVTFYGTGSFKHRISGALMDHNDASDEEEVRREAVFAMICSCLAIPGYLLSIAFIDMLGRYRIQLWGFLAMAVNFFAVAWLSLNRETLPGHARWAMLFCFGLTFLFSNFGPNTTTFVLPVEVYPTLIRATCHGVSAAFGKLGAVIGVVAFSPCEEAFGVETVLCGCGVVCIVGALFTIGFTREAPVTLDELDVDVLPGDKKAAAPA